MVNATFACRLFTPPVFGIYLIEKALSLKSISHKRWGFKDLWVYVIQSSFDKSLHCHEMLVRMQIPRVLCLRHAVVFFCLSRTLLGSIFFNCRNLMCPALMKLWAVNAGNRFTFFGMHRRQQLHKCKHFWEELYICNASKVVPINPLGPIVHGFYFSSDNVFSIRCICKCGIYHLCPIIYSSVFAFFRHIWIPCEKRLQGRIQDFF